MAILNIRTHTGTNGATATTGNTGYDSETGGGTAPTFTTGTAPPNAASCITWTGGTAARQFIANDDARCSVILVRINATPSNPITFTRKRTSGGTALAQVRITTSRTVDLRDGSATVDTSAFALVNNTWYQFVFDVDGSAGGTIQIWSADGQTLHDTVSGTVGSGAVGDQQVGQFNASSSPIFLGQHVLADAFIGPEIRPLKPEKNSLAGQSSLARAVGRSYQWREAVSGLLVPIRTFGVA